jgi:hypothetical protein
MDALAEELGMAGAMGAISRVLELMRMGEKIP